MSILNQKTISKSIVIGGVGLHSGKKVSMKLNPSEPNSGIVFKRVDIKKNNIVIPSVFNVSEANYCTTISNEFGIKVSTIEHLMGALYGLGVDNLLVEVDNQELPILDGSAKIFIDEINSVGLKTSNIPIKIIKINNRVTIEDGSKKITIEPSKISLDIDFEIKFNNPLIGTQRNKVKIYEEDLSDIFNSRTFCLFEDIEKLREMNLAQGGTLQNAIVVKDEKILNEEGLRNKKEFVNHKILDCLGDIYLSGYKMVGNIKCSQGGHRLTNQVLRKVFENKENYSIIEIKEKYLPHTLVRKSQLKSIA
jgi:UDP-3-O-[3-hydroxymyristoyl] N-acetylglucosamine deacetylase|tara:strand:+ start:1078 stop:1998 length:921 start_codon:yes stop_codon:yes gene_type:complete